MATLPTLPRRTWLEQLSLGLALVLILVGALSLAGWWLHLDTLVRPLMGFAAIKANAAFCWLFLGLALLTVELGLPQFAWVATLPASVGLLTLIEHIAGIDLRIDELLAPDHLMSETTHPGRMAAVSAGCIFLGGVVLAWRTFAPAARARIFAAAFAGSILGSVGLSTLLGYATNLPIVYRWGSGTATSPVCDIALLTLGCALLLTAWREGNKAENGPPSWSPMPAVIVCLSLSVVLWIGLRARELDYLGADTQTTINSLAITIDRELKQLTSDVDDRLAAPWSRVAEDSDALWEVYAALFFSVVKDNGGTAVAWVDPRADLSLRTRWIYPLHGNEGAISFDHLLDKGRAEAIGAAQLSDHSVVSGTIAMPNGRGFVIYTVVRRQGAIAGYVAAEFSYAGFFGSIDRQLNLSKNYYAAIAMDGEPVYATFLTDENHDNGQAYSVVIQRHRFRLNLAPTAEYLRNNRRFLPELALIAGLGITGLLGLSAFLARRARAGQLAAEESNRRLLAENEKRSRVEARLQTSDERLRLTLDSTGIGIFEWNVALGYVYYSPGLWTMLGYDHGRMPATVEALQSLIHPEDLPLYRRRTETQLSGGTSFIEPEFRVRARTGEWRWVYVRAKSVATAAGGLPTRILGTIQDITARREAEEALRASQASTRKLSLVASRTDNLVIIFTADGRVEWANESFTRTMEYPLPEIVGKLSTELLAGPETDPRAIARLRTALAHGQGLSTDIVQYAKSGRKYHLAFEIQPVRNQAGDEVLREAGWDDCCPFWDNDGQGYLVGSNFRDGYKIHLWKLTPDGRELIKESDRVIHQSKGSEANKLYQFNGIYYHLFSEVKGEGRVVMMERSTNIYGPYTEIRQLNHADRPARPFSSPRERASPAPSTSWTSSSAPMPPPASASSPASSATTPCAPRTIPRRSAWSSTVPARPATCSSARSAPTPASPTMSAASSTITPRRQACASSSSPSSAPVPTFPPSPPATPSATSSSPSPGSPACSPSPSTSSSTASPNQPAPS